MNKDENKDKYASYFEEEQTTSNSKSKICNQKNEGQSSSNNKPITKSIDISKEFYNYKIPFSKPRKNSSENFEKPNQPSVHRKIIKDVQDLQELDLEQLYFQPYSNLKYAGDKSDKSIEHFESIDDLLDKYDDEEYEIVGMNEIQQYLGKTDKDPRLEQIERGSPDEQISYLEKQFEVEKENYEILYKLIYLYRTHGHKEKLKQMREYTFNLFPFGDDMWKEWINDELKEFSQDDFDKKYLLIQTHFERAIKDFYCKNTKEFLFIKLFIFLDFKICKKFMKFLINLRKEIDSKNNQLIENYDYDKFHELSIENIRKRFEQYLEIWGLDFNLSTGLWDLYISFENTNLEKFKKEKDEQNVNLTINLIRSIYRRRLSFPHIDLDIVWREYKNLETSIDELQKVEIKFHESSKKAEEMINLEEKFIDILDSTKSDDNSAQLCEFLKSEISESFKKTFNYIRLYFERSLEINPDDEKIWILYIEVSKTIHKNPSFNLSLLLRASKCCYFNIVIWVMLFREMERLQMPFEEIQAKIRVAYASAPDDENFLSEIWKYSLEYECRIYDGSQEQLVHLRNLFSNAISDIQTKGNKDYIVKILGIWAEFEVFKVMEESKINDIMNRVVKLSPTADNWKIYVNYQKVLDDREGIRKTYKRALEFCKEEKDYFSENWIMWEKIFGTVDTIEYALNYSKLRTKKQIRKPIKLSLIGKKHTDQNAGYKLDQESAFDKGQGDKRIIKKIINEKSILYTDDDRMHIDDPEETTIARKSNKHNKDSNKREIYTTKATSEMEIEDDKNLNFNKSNKTVIIKNLSPITKEEDLEENIKKYLPESRIQDIRVVRDRKGNSKGFAFVDFYTLEDAHECAIMLNNKILEDNIVSCAVSKPPKLGENDKRTIFVNNISYDSTEERIKSVFESFGQILDVRIIYDKETKKPKGYCYVEFMEEESVGSVMQNKNNFVVDGRKVMVKTSQSVAKIREKLKYVAHITNLPFSISEEKLKEFLSKNDVDKIIDCLITKDETGNSKGFGFVEFEDEESLKKALLLTGKIIRGRPVTIKMSTRNITRNNKRKASLEIEDLKSEIKIGKKQKLDEIKTSEPEEVKKELGLSNKDFRKFLK